jgi:hypothetical protein
MSWMLPCVPCQQSLQPLSEEEKRKILAQLFELKSCREALKQYRIYVERDIKLDESTKAVTDRAIELEKKATAIAEKERDLYKSQAEFYENAWKVVKKKKGFGCILKSIFTLGIARCR